MLLMPFVLKQGEISEISVSFSQLLLNISIFILLFLILPVMGR